SVSVVTPEDIADNAALNLDDALRYEPGIDLLDYSSDSQHPTSNSIGMRGLGGGAQGISRALVMEDGVPINDPFFGYIQWNRVPLDDISHVEIVRGGGSPLWGNYAEGGVINIVTQSYETDRLSLDAAGGSYGFYRASADGFYRLDDQNVLEIFGEAGGTSGYQQVPVYERAPFNVPSGSDALNLHLRDSFEGDGLTAHFTLDLHGNHQRLETLLDTNSQRNVVASGDIARQFGANSSLALTMFYGDSNFDTNNSTYFPVEGDVASTTQSLNEIHHVRAHDFGGSLIWSQETGGWLKNYMVGGDWHAIYGDDHTQHFVAPDFSATNFNTMGGGDQLFLAGFAQATLAPIEALEIVASGRFQYLRNSNGLDGSVGGLGAVPSNDVTSFVPRVNLRYALPDGFALRGAYYQSFRAPNIGDQFYTYAAGGFVQLPAPLLKPERLNGGEAGFDFTGEGFRAQLTAYRTSIDNYIVAEATTNPIYSPNGWYVVQNQNVAAVQAQGFEAEANWDIGGGFAANAAYTFADSVVKKNPFDPQSVGQQIIDVPRNRVGGGLSYTAPGGWRIGTAAEFVSRTDWASPDHTDPGYPGKISADPHFVMSLSASYPVWRRADAYVEIQNLTDTRYVATSYSAPSPQAYGTPFEAFGGLRIRLE
ncbi:MAG TPA: TonB-dependent receptor, partial [Rhizomicrobium sp.]|nr:TonB-dependent receptor [Rhizomicrobium sp.]